MSHYDSLPLATISTSFQRVRYHRRSSSFPVRFDLHCTNFYHWWRIQFLSERNDSNRSRTGNKLFPVVRRHVKKLWGEQGTERLVSQPASQLACPSLLRYSGNIRCSFNQRRLTTRLLRYCSQHRTRHVFYHKIPFQIVILKKLVVLSNNKSN